jgi:hypothetical protein
MMAFLRKYWEIIGIVGLLLVVIFGGNYRRNIDLVNGTYHGVRSSFIDMSKYPKRSALPGLSAAKIQPLGVQVQSAQTIAASSSSSLKATNWIQGGEFIVIIIGLVFALAFGRIGIKVISEGRVSPLISMVDPEPTWAEVERAINKSGGE